MPKFNIEKDIRRARTLPGDFYRKAENFEAVKEKIFARSSHWAGENDLAAEPTDVHPFALLPGVLDEPLLWTRDAGGTRHCLSNVCTHRAKLLVAAPAKMRLLSCGYHGRCFGLDGRFRSMPKFEGVENFPAPEDSLPRVPFADFLGSLYVSPEPAVPFLEMAAPILERTGWLPLDTLAFAPEASRDYFVEANWALYCDNYLEGFHIPFVHPALNQAIDFGRYESEIFPFSNLQTGIARAGEPCFDIPPGWPDHGKQVYGWYFWLFPNLMFNFYPWGLSLNIVEPLSPTRSRVRFRSYFFAGTDFDRERNALDATELEDESVVESAQIGVRSRFYRAGRFSPEMERGVHHFHGLVAEWMG